MEDIQQYQLQRMIKLFLKYYLQNKKYSAHFSENKKIL